MNRQSNVPKMGICGTHTELLVTHKTCHLHVLIHGTCPVFVHVIFVWFHGHCVVLLFADSEGAERDGGSSANQSHEVPHSRC